MPIGTENLFFNLWRDTSSCLPNVRHLTFLILLLYFFFFFFASIDAGNPRQSIRFAIRICNEFVCSTAYRDLFSIFKFGTKKKWPAAHVGKYSWSFHWFVLLFLLVSTSMPISNTLSTDVALFWTVSTIKTIGIVVILFSSSRLVFKYSIMN